MRISERDYRASLAVVHAVAEAETPERFAELSLAGIARLVPSDAISLNEVEPSASRLAYSVHPADFVSPPGSAETLARLAATHPLIMETDRTGDGSAMKISDLLTIEQWHAHRLYVELYAAMGVEHQMSITLAAPRPTVVAFAASRSRRDFDERDRAVLDLVRPHLAQSWRTARERHRLNRMLASSADALDADGASVVLLEDPPVEVTPGALLDVYRFFGRPAPDGVLPPAVVRWVEAQRASAASDSELLRPLSASLGGRRLVLRFLPGGVRHPDAVLVRRTDTATVEPRLAAVGLTPREAEVLRLVSSGATNAEIGERMNVAASTVKKHLDGIYRKLGVSGRMRAVAAATEILAHHPD